MNVFSQSASRAEADSGDDSELSLSLFEKVQNEPVSFGQTKKSISLTLSIRPAPCAFKY